MSIESVCGNCNFQKYLVDSRYAVYLYNCASHQNLVVDTKTGIDITATDDGSLIMIMAYNYKNENRGD
jgi:hypothetical protein